MTQKLTTIGHRTAFINEQSPQRIVSYKRPRNDNVKQFKRENQRPYLFKLYEVLERGISKGHYKLIIAHQYILDKGQRYVKRGK